MAIRLTYQEVKKIFSDENCILLDETYINTKTKMKYQCSCGEIDYKSLTHFKRGQRCEKCGIDKRLLKDRTPYVEVKDFFESCGYALLETNYIKMSIPMDCICSCGNKTKKTLSALKLSPKCTCHNKNIPFKKGVRYTDDELINIFWDFYYKNKRFMTPKDLKDNPTLPSSNAYYRWGKWNEFLEFLGILGSDGWYIFDEKILINMYGVSSEKEILDSLMIKRKWGSVKQKANKLGLKMKRFFTDDELLTNIKSFYDDNGRNPTINDFKNIEPNYYVYRNRFKNWNNVLKLAGLDVKENVSFSNKDISNIINDYNNGITAKEIANNYSVYESRIHYELRKNNIPIRTNKWSDAMILKLKKLYPLSNWDLILKELSPFKKEDIITKAYKLKLKRECYGYTKEEEQVLLDNYGKVSFKIIRNLLPNKSDASIMTKASKMGLIMMEKWSEDEILKLSTLYPFYTNEEIVEFFPNRTLNAIMSMATMKLNLYKDERYLSEKYYKREKERMLKELIEFSNELGRTPTTDEIQENKKISGSASYHRIFGSYSEACKLAGIEVNASMFGKSIHYLSKNKDVCLSKKELQITNILIDNNIHYVKEKLYKDILKDDKLSNIRTDWFINNEIIIEYFGMPEKNGYRERMNEKIKLCKDNNIILIDLYPEDAKYNFNGMYYKFLEHGIKLKINQDIIKQVI